MYQRIAYITQEIINSLDVDILPKYHLSMTQKPTTTSD